MGRVNRRTFSMKFSTKGLNVRFFAMIIANGQGGAGKSIGKTFRENRSLLRRTAEFDIVAMKSPDAIILARRTIENVIKLMRGMLNPRDQNAWDTILWLHPSASANIQGSSTSSARSLPRLDGSQR